MSLQLFHLNSSSCTTNKKEIYLQHNEPFIVIIQKARNLFGNKYSVPKKELLIKNINLIDIKITNSYCLILDNLGKVYYFKNDNKKRIFDKFIDGDAINQPQLINFTIKDPITNIFGKFGDLSILLSKKGNIYILGIENIELQINQYLEDGIKFKKEFIYNENVIEAVCGESYFLLLTETGKVFGFGSNTWGQLGKVYNTFSNLVESKIDHISSKIVKLYATYSTSFALTENGELYSCGSKDYAANGMEFGSVYDPHIFTRVPIEERVIDVYNGYFFVAVKTIDSKFYIFGYNNFNQFGNIQTGRSDNRIYGPTLLETFNTNEIKEMECGGYGSIIITKQNKVFASGDFLEKKYQN
ncbi:hypothetical protein ABK040_016619 [Willaertia magna]